MSYSSYTLEIKQILLILVLCFITIGLFYGNKKFEYIGNELIKNGDFHYCRADFSPLYFSELRTEVRSTALTLTYYDYFTFVNLSP